MSRFAVCYANIPFNPEITKGAMATPRLIEAGKCEAYFVPIEKGDIPGIWYKRDPGYESPNGEYTTVVVREVNQ